MIVCVNKMDAIDYNEERFNEIKAEASDYLKQVGFKIDTIPFIPVSGFQGDNLIEKSENIPWYKGKTLIDALNDLKAPKRPINKPLRIPIQAVYKISGVGTVVCGRVETGILKPNDKITIAPSGTQTIAKSVEMNHEKMVQAIPGDNIGFNVTKVSVKEIKRGFVASNSANMPA